MRTPSTPRRLQRGTTLLEALVAFLVLSLGMLTVVRVQTQLRFSSDVARQRTEAVRLGQEDLETLRAFSVLAASAGRRAYADLTSTSRQVDSASGYATNTRYTVARQIDPASTLRAKNATVTVSWNDRAGDAQQVVLNSVIAGTDPAYSGALALPRDAGQARGPLVVRCTFPSAPRTSATARAPSNPQARATWRCCSTTALGR